MSDNVVWVISKGSYSDYRVMCACPSKGAATLVAKRYNEIEDTTYDHRDFEKFCIDPAEYQK